MNDTAPPGRTNGRADQPNPPAGDPWGRATDRLAAAVLSRAEHLVRLREEDFATMAPGPVRDLVAEAWARVVEIDDLPRGLVPAIEWVVARAKDQWGAPMFTTGQAAWFASRLREHQGAGDSLTGLLADVLTARDDDEGRHERARELVDRVMADFRQQGPADPDADPLDKLIKWDEFWAKDRTEPEWVVENVLARRRGHAIWAKGGNGKSEFVQWVALEALNAGHVVLYLDYEMIDDDLYDRFEAMGLGPETDLSRLGYALIPDLRPMDTPGGADDVAALVDALAARHPGRHLVVVIDTIGRAVEGEENSNDTVLNFYRHTGYVLKAREVTWVRLDHTGHEGEHARGGSAKRDDVDVVWKHERTDAGCRLVADKRRASWIPEKSEFDRLEEPHLHYRPAPLSFPAGTSQVAADLDALGVPVEVSWRDAAAALKGAGKGRRAVVVRAAVRWRKMGSGTPSERRDPPRDPPPAGPAGPTPGPTTQKARNHG